MDKRELGVFLRSRRERVTPADVGLPAGRRRRTPGLRRDEVARLAFISTEYYTRLEQARASRPSREVLSGLARALRLSEAERGYLHQIADSEPAPPTGPPRAVRQSILDLMNRLPLTAAIVTSATHEVIGWNDLACALLEDFSALAPRDRNLVRRLFLGPHHDGQRLYGLSDAAEFALASVHDLRAAAARYPDDLDVNALISELLSSSSEFKSLWDAREIPVRTALSKTFTHPVVGPVTVNCDILDIAERDQRLVIYTAEPGSPSEQALQLLSVVGTQRLDASSRDR
ncbi:helix-turn-helix domain-containing protein [Mycolicibacterium sp. 018/SC-01/001]|uniref:helix-turn-helix transcriptional regulator n=1 Tax=Mycolicibacterium sp. 018/SC-01/001 TaxID=2592069 RepID=UPI00117C6D2B|nr:helix-turn-helix transcriptional regulator [Mycolicibacterium sp. 018/SC-01/001]TRW89135.1 helix-turn-helix domain-containing protein [Mycolicibacterium sp. 018/SC-01/001]